MEQQQNNNSYNKKRRVDPLCVAVIAMLLLVPTINACSTTPTNQRRNTQQINTANVKTNTLQLPDGYEWNEDNEDDFEDDIEESVTSSFKTGQTMSFRADKNAPTATRLAAIEEQLTSLRNDFNELYPSMRRLMAIEQDMQELISELKSLTTDTTPAPVTTTMASQPLNEGQILTKEQALAQDQQLRMQAQQQSGTTITPPTSTYMAPETITEIAQTSATLPTPLTAPTTHNTTNIAQNTPTTTPSPAPEAAPAPTPVPATGVINATATGLRIGIHEDTVRIVVDYTAASQVSFNQTLNGNIFELHLPNTAYQGRKSWQSEYVPMVNAYNVVQNGSDTYIKFNLKPNTTVKTAFIIPPKSASQTSRLVVDFTE